MTTTNPLRMPEQTSDETDGAVQARAAVGPTLGAGAVLAEINGRSLMYGDVEPGALVAELARVTGDETATGTDTLLTQAVVLDRLFTHLAAKAMQTDSVHLCAIKLKLALRAQAQCRATLEAVSNIRHPRQYVGTQHVGEQYNAAGHQQVNRRARTGENPPIEVSEVSSDVSAP